MHSVRPNCFENGDIAMDELGLFKAKLTSSYTWQASWQARLEWQVTVGWQNALLLQKKKKKNSMCKKGMKFFVFTKKCLRYMQILVFWQKAQFWKLIAQVVTAAKK